MAIRSHQGEHRLTIQGAGTATKYVLATTEPITGDESTLDVADDGQVIDHIGNMAASGWVTRTENVDEYVFTGEVIAFEFLTGEADLQLDGSPITPEELESTVVTGVQTCVDGGGDCASGEVCIDGLCVSDPGMTGCETGDCPTGFTCEAGLCIEDVSGQPGDCATGDCPSGFVCDGGLCVEDTTNGGGDPGTCQDGDCPTGFTCEAGLCVEDTTNGNGNGNGNGGTPPTQSTAVLAALAILAGVAVAGASRGRSGGNE